tara:strand:- start:11 stop:586 length:576 start_codon:yes stop_codon:yes gene_type:complete
MDYEIILDIFISTIIPATFKSVNKGNKVFGGAVLNKKDLSIITFGLNNEIINPLLHGEISTINNFFRLNNKFNPKDCIFISTHEPCSMCLSAITWSGFKNFYFFFPYSDTKNKFSIPHDLKIMSEIFNLNNGEYIKNNQYWNSYSIIEEINRLPNEMKDSLKVKINQIYKEYENLSDKYQQNKIQNKIPLN